MKNITCIIFFLIVSSLAYAGKGVVIVLQAPLLNNDNFDSPAVTHVRKGQEIYIHDKHFGLSSDNITFEGMADDEDIDKVEDGYDKEGFFQTLDASGNAAYIEKKYIKLIFNDRRELFSKVRPFKYDPTDYRLEEPLQKNYPIAIEKMFRAGAFMAFGPPRHVNYNYVSPVVAQNFSTRIGAEIFYAKKVDFDLYDRFYFGGMGHIYSFNSESSMQDDSTAEEKGGEFGAGPFLSYIFFRNNNWRMTFSGGLTLNYYRSLVKIGSEDGDDEEERFFDGFYFTPKIKTYIVAKNITPAVDFMAGFDITMNIPTNISGSTPIRNNNQWQEDPAADNIHLPFGAIWSFIIGINATH
ncbi:MAG: hypothetical protein HN576_10840 [Bacteriovoracaceae bacterium]|nr:hypothetical protein [Bacteriovoracaceae bacterium]